MPLQKKNIIKLSYYDLLLFATLTYVKIKTNHGDIC
jgi:hypothetical protein